MIQQTQSQRQTLKFLPQQIQFLNFLQLTSVELESYIKNELEENPALDEGNGEEIAESQEEWEDAKDETQTEILQDYYDLETLDNDIPEYKTRADNFAQDDPDFEVPIAQVNSFQEDLFQQLHWLSLSEREVKLAEYLLNSLDEDGFLRADLEELADDLSFAHNIFVETEELEKVLKIIQSLEPIGTGARNLKEFLLIQLENGLKKGEKNHWAMILVENNLNELIQKNYQKIVKETDISEENFQQVLQQIAKLNPKPFAGQTDTGAYGLNVYPEMIITIQNDQLEIFLNQRNLPELRINTSLLAMASENNKATAQFAKSKIKAASWLIDAIKQRESTMLQVMKTIIYLQPEYFKNGDVKQLRPMILKDVADLVKMDISTISRVTSNKYVQTHFGVILLKDLFSEGITNQDGKEVSNREIQETMLEIIAQEDKHQPMSDQQIVVALAERGYPIARRTVAKYREHLAIAPANLRKSW
jgi:RNA polymerase sigma-54 factor